MIAKRAVTGRVVRAYDPKSGRRELTPAVDGKYYARYNGGEAVEYNSKKERDDAVLEFIKANPDAKKIEQWED